MNNPLLRQIGENLKRLRKRAGLTQYDLEAASGVSRATVTLIERGKINTTSIDTLQKLAAALDVPLADLTAFEIEQAEAKAYVEDFIASTYADDLRLTEDEIRWLRSLPTISWQGQQPTNRTFSKLIEALREADS